MRHPLLLTLRPGVTEDEISRIVSRLPASVDVTPDFELRTLVVQWGDNGELGSENATHAVLAGCGYFFAGPGSEEAVRRYWPDDDRPSSWAMYDNDGWHILCERCEWGARHETREDADGDARRHDREVHGDSEPTAAPRSGRRDVEVDAALHHVAVRLEADLRLRFPDVVVRFGPDFDGTWVCHIDEDGVYWGHVTTSFHDEDDLSPTELERLLADVTVDVADNLWPDDSTDSWPVCPRHGDHPLQVRFVDGLAEWVCLQDRSVAIPVGDLRARTERR